MSQLEPVIAKLIIATGVICNYISGQFSLSPFLAKYMYVRATNIFCKTSFISKLHKSIFLWCIVILNHSHFINISILLQNTFLLFKDKSLKQFLRKFLILNKKICWRLLLSSQKSKSKVSSLKSKQFGLWLTLRSKGPPTLHLYIQL